MSIIAEFTVPAEAFALEDTFERTSDAAIEVERLATHSREWVMPFLWVTGNDIGTVQRALRDDPSVAELQAMDTDGAVGQFNIEWSDDVQQVVDQIVDQHGIIQEAEATDGVWYLKLKFIDQKALGEFRSYFDEQGYAFELQSLYEGTAPKEREYDLTTEQREALVTALEMGYFAVPRDAQIEELADELGISTNAVSQRLRRATENLTRNTLTTAAPEGASEAE